MTNDKEIERVRYDQRARKILSIDDKTSVNHDTAISPVLAGPYIRYQKELRKHIAESCKVLEIGAGCGENTHALLHSGALVTALDISGLSLKSLRNRYGAFDRLNSVVGDIESLPFSSNSYDVVVSAGSLSYGDNKMVRDEIFRVLKEGGVFICVDSLNHNPMYVFNRWLHAKRQRRTISTTQRMPTLKLLESYRDAFGQSSEFFFGSISWLALPVSKIIGVKVAANFSDRVDRIIRTKKSAFKFVMVVRKVNS